MLGIEFHPVDWLMKKLEDNMKRTYPYETFLDEAIDRNYSAIYVTSKDNSGSHLDGIVSFTGKTFIHFEGSKQRLIAKYTFADLIKNYNSSFLELEAWRLEKVDELRRTAHEKSIKVIDNCKYIHLAPNNAEYRMLL